MVTLVPMDQQGFLLLFGQCQLTIKLSCVDSLCVSFQYGNVGAMAITLCQSLGQNIGMRWNNARNSAGKRQHERRYMGKDREIYRPRFELNTLSKQESKMNVGIMEAEDNSEGWD